MPRKNPDFSTVGFVGFVDALFGFFFAIELGVEYDQRKRHGKRF